MSFNFFMSLMPELPFCMLQGRCDSFWDPIHRPARLWQSIYLQTAVTNKTETTHVVKKTWSFHEETERREFFFLQGVFFFFSFFTSDGQACKLRIYVVFPSSASFPTPVTSFPPPSPLSLPLNLTVPSHPGRSKLHCRGQIRKWRRVFQQTVKAKVASNHS